MPIIEEISEDELEFDESDFDGAIPFAKGAGDDDGLGPAKLIPKTEAKQPEPKKTIPTQSPLASFDSQPNLFPRQAPGASGSSLQNNYIEDMEQFKDWNIIYPIYFNKDRSHSEGRKVPTDLAVSNPMVTTIMAALKSFKVPMILEPEKTHPKDWAHPGRIRYLIHEPELDSYREAEGLKKIETKRQLYKLIGEYLVAHPTTTETPKENPLYRGIRQALIEQQQQLPEQNRISPGQVKVPYGPKEFPKGWKDKKVGSILPPHSPALPFGEMSESLMESLTKNMFGGLPGMAPGAAAPAPQKPKKIFIRK